VQKIAGIDLVQVPVGCGFLDWVSQMHSVGYCVVNDHFCDYSMMLQPVPLIRRVFVVKLKSILLCSCLFKSHEADSQGSGRS